MLKRTTLTLSYYVISLTLLFLVNDLYPSGPCTPGPAILIFMLLIPWSIVLLIRNIYVTSKVGRANALAMAIHVVACVLMISPLINL